MEAGKRTAVLCRRACGVAAFAVVVRGARPGRIRGPVGVLALEPLEHARGAAGPDLRRTTPTRPCSPRTTPAWCWAAGPAGSDSHDRDYAKPTYFASPADSLPDRPRAPPRLGARERRISRRVRAGPAGGAGRRRLGRPPRDRSPRIARAAGRCGAASRARTPAPRAPRPTSSRAATTPPTWRCGTSAARASRSAAATPPAEDPERPCTRRS